MGRKLYHRQGHWIKSIMTSPCRPEASPTAPGQLHGLISLWPRRLFIKRLALSSFLHSFTPSFLHSFIPSFLHSFIPSFLHSFIPSFLHSFTCVPSKQSTDGARGESLADLGFSCFLSFVSFLFLFLLLFLSICVPCIFSMLNYSACSVLYVNNDTRADQLIYIRCRYRDLLSR